MDLLERLNASINYIEENLDGEICYEEASRIACCSSYYYQRMFSYITDMTLSEYIRRRRMTLAALELQNSDSRVLDVALKYGYNSPTSFTRAFIREHGINPSEAKNKGVHINFYPPISFNISIRGGIAMNYKIEEKDAFRLVGIKENVSTVDEYNFKRIPQIWEEVNHNGKCSEISKLADGSINGVMGVCADFNKDNFNYYIASVTTKEVPEGMSELNIKKGTWAIFKCKGVSEIQDAWKKIFTDWFPTSGYEHADEAEIEYYPFDENDPENVVCEIWIPVLKK